MEAPLLAFSQQLMLLPHLLGPLLSHLQLAGGKAIHKGRREVKHH